MNFMGYQITFNNRNELLIWVPKYINFGPIRFTKSTGNKSTSNYSQIEYYVCKQQYTINRAKNRELTNDVCESDNSSTILQDNPNNILISSTKCKSVYYIYTYYNNKCRLVYNTTHNHIINFSYLKFSFKFKNGIIRTNKQKDPAH